MWISAGRTVRQPVNDRGHFFWCLQRPNLCNYGDSTQRRRENGMKLFHNTAGAVYLVKPGLIHRIFLHQNCSFKLETTALVSAYAAQTQPLIWFLHCCCFIWSLIWSSVRLIFFYYTSKNYYYYTTNWPVSQDSCLSWELPIVNNITRSECWSTALMLQYKVGQQGLSYYIGLNGQSAELVW